MQMIKNSTTNIKK